MHAFVNPEKALDHIEIDGYKDCSLLVSDVRMPQINAIQIAKRVKQLRPEMKIILMTAFAVYKE